MAKMVSSNHPFAFQSTTTTLPLLLRIRFLRPYRRIRAVIPVMATRGEGESVELSTRAMMAGFTLSDPSSIHSMASSSTTSVPKSTFKYDVFLSFRGEDTRTNFTDHLYSSLKQKSIYTYKDDERIKKGKRIGDELIRSIEDSRFYIIVFSKNYASSSWCLDELVKIMECHKQTGHTAYPVFYDVIPSEVRNQSGAVGEAFAKHEKVEAAGKWREALKEAADLAGWELKKTDDGHEAKFIKRIVEEVSLELRSVNFRIDEKLVGMETRINNIVSSLETRSHDVCMIGIWGMGGGGKTTLARAVFDKISFQFEEKSFVANVREVSNASLSGLHLLQKQVLSDILNDQNIKISNVFEGKNMMRGKMPSRKVLIVLDDVDHIDQLEALAGDWFKPGSIIFITTRDKQLLVAHKVKLVRNVNLLSDDEAICLFSKCAFGKEIPVQGYEELSGQIVRYAAGLPLTITVLGSFLCGKNEPEWIDALERLKTIPLMETQKKLELSYMSLEQDYKEIFLDIACILKGRRKSYVIEVLESCGFHARNGLRVLEQKSLINFYYLYDEECVGMHDHIEGMGRHIVRRSHPDMPHKHSRLWITNEIEDILVNDLGTEATRCLQFHTSRLDAETVMKGLQKMKELRFLDVSVSRSDSTKTLCFCWKPKFDKVSPYFPDALRYLSWHNYPFRSLPKAFKGTHLVTLQMSSTRWEGRERMVFNKLKHLQLCDSYLRTLDLGLTPNLETMKLVGELHLVKLDMQVECPNLRSLDLPFTKSRTFDLGLTPNLEELTLKRRDNNYVQLHMSTICLNLRSLVLYGIKSRTFDLGLTPNLTSLTLEHSKFIRTLDIGLTPNLEVLRVSGCNDLEELQMANESVKLKRVIVECLNLRTLDLGHCPNLEWSYFTVFNLEEFRLDECPMLTYFSIWSPKLRTLDLRQVPNLGELYLVKCRNFVELHLPSSCMNLNTLIFSNLKLRTLTLGIEGAPILKELYLADCHDLEKLHMGDECKKLKYLTISHSKVRTLDLGVTPNLEKLDLKGCYNLVEFHAPIGCLKNILKLELSGCLGFSSLSVYINDYTSPWYSFRRFSAKLDFTLERCPFHPENNLPKFEFTSFHREDIPSVTTSLEKLISKGPCSCAKLEAFSISMCELQR
ncbi:hypothetical protein LXL04_016286 [Taraxacum kok-saghyz]